MTWETVLNVVAVAVPAFIIALLGYRRSRQVDAVAEKSGLAANGRAGTAQIIEGLKILVDNLQEDNKSFREEIRLLTDRCEIITKERDTLKMEVARLLKKYGGDEEPKPL